MPRLVEIGLAVLEKKNFINAFSLSRNYLPLEKDANLHLNKRESPLPMDVCAKFGCNWPSGSGEEDF